MSTWTPCQSSSSSDSCKRPTRGCKHFASNRPSANERVPRLRRKPLPLRLPRQVLPQKNPAVAAAAATAAAAAAAEEKEINDPFPHMALLPNVLQGIVGTMLDASDLLIETRRAALRKQEMAWHDELQYLCATDPSQLAELAQLPKKLVKVKHLSLCLAVAAPAQGVARIVAGEALRSFAARLETLEINMRGKDREWAENILFECFEVDDEPEVSYPALTSVMIDLTNVKASDSSPSYHAFLPGLFRACPALRHLSITESDANQTRRFFRAHKNKERTEAHSDSEEEEDQELDDATLVRQGFERLHSLRIDWPGFASESLRYGWVWPVLRFYSNTTLCWDVQQFASKDFPALEGLVTQELDVNVAYENRILGDDDFHWGENADRESALFKAITNANSWKRVPVQNKTLRFLHIVKHEVYHSRTWVSLALAFPALEVLCSDIGLTSIADAVDATFGSRALWPQLHTLLLRDTYEETLDVELTQAGIKAARQEPNPEAIQAAQKAFLLASHMSTWSSACTIGSNDDKAVRRRR
jgi:hypothetical protein